MIKEISENCKLMSVSLNKLYSPKNKEVYIILASSTFFVCILFIFAETTYLEAKDSVNQPANSTKETSKFKKDWSLTIVTISVGIGGGILLGTLLCCFLNWCMGIHSHGNDPPPAPREGPPSSSQEDVFSGTALPTTSINIEYPEHQPYWKRNKSCKAVKKHKRRSIIRENRHADKTVEKAEMKAAKRYEPDKNTKSKAGYQDSPRDLMKQLSSLQQEKKAPEIVFTNSEKKTSHRHSKDNSTEKNSSVETPNQVHRKHKRHSNNHEHLDNTDTESADKFELKHAKKHNLKKDDIGHQEPHVYIKKRTAGGNVTHQPSADSKARSRAYEHQQSVFENKKDCKHTGHFKHQAEWKQLELNHTGHDGKEMLQTTTNAGKNKPVCEYHHGESETKPSHRRKHSSHGVSHTGHGVTKEHVTKEENVFRKDSELLERFRLDQLLLEKPSTESHHSRRHSWSEVSGNDRENKGIKEQGDEKMNCRRTSISLERKLQRENIKENPEDKGISKTKDDFKDISFKADEKGMRHTMESKLSNVGTPSTNEAKQTLPSHASTDNVTTNELTKNHPAKMERPTTEKIKNAPPKQKLPGIPQPHNNTAIHFSPVNQSKVTQNISDA